MKAKQFLETSIATLAERGSTYESGKEENSMREITALARALIGAQVSELEGWYIMLALKLVRLRKSIEQGKASKDSIVDLLGYTAKLGECLFPESEPGTTIQGRRPQFDAANYAAVCSGPRTVCPHFSSTIKEEGDILKLVCDECGKEFTAREYVDGE